MDHLSSLAQYQNAVNIGSSMQNGKINTSGASSSDSASSNAQQNVDQLKAGDTISGQVVETDGNNVKIAVNENYVIQAKLEQELSLISGKNMIFEVKGNTGNQVSLSPLFANMAGEANAQKALQAANLPMNQNTMKLVASLMEEGMSIDKNTLSQVYREGIQNPDASQSAILQLNKMEVPVNAENLQQLDLYMNYKHQLLQGIEDVASQIPELYQALSESGDMAKANQFMGQLLEIFGETGPAAGLAGQNGEEAAALEGELLADGQKVTLNGNAEGASAGTANGQTVTVDGAVVNSELMKEAAKEVLLDSMQEAGLTENGVKTDGTVLDGKENMLTDTNVQNPQEQLQSAILELTPNQTTEMSNLMKQMGMSQDVVNQFQMGNMSPQELMKLVSQSLAENKVNSSAAAELIKSSGFQKIFQSEVAKQWLLQPEDVRKEGVIDQFYERLRNQTNKISQMLEQAGQGESALAKSTQNIRSNVNFMNDLNHMFTYVQLPLKFSEGKAHGDLYVYTNKKSLARDTGEVSALLHLDMEHLGQMDVHVKLTKGEKVSTKFYLADDDTLDFISEHIDMLNERLESRGYQASANFEVRNESKNVMQEMAEASGGKPTLLATQSFDARA